MKMRNKLSRAVETRFIASAKPQKIINHPVRFASTPPLEGNIKALLSETVNYGSNAAVFFEVELKDGSLAQINVNQLFSDREFLNNCSREMYGHLCHRKGYMMGR
jgi:hypothetical protein